VQQQPQPRTVEEAIASTDLPDLAKDWLRRHPEYVSDKAKSDHASRMHETAKYLAGGEQFTQRYLDKLEEVLGMRSHPQQEDHVAPPRTNGAVPPPPPRQAAPQPQPQRPQQPVPQQYRGAPPSAPVARSAPSMSTGRPHAELQPLTRAEAEIAIASKPRGDMTDAEAMQLYQKHKHKLLYPDHGEPQMGPKYRG
jgi:hypothetical protein